jgi:hypothetical protein
MKTVTAVFGFRTVLPYMRLSSSHFTSTLKIEAMRSSESFVTT